MPLTFDHTVNSGKKDTLDPDRLVVAWQSFYGPAGDVKAEDELRASDARVRQAPSYFCELDIPKDERPSVLDLAFATEKARVAAVEAERQAHFEASARGNKVKLSVQLFRLQRDIFARVGGLPATVERGSVVLGNDPLIAEHPDAFKPA